MITTKFVKLAREVIQFIRNGNRLTYSQFIYCHTKKTACVLGAVSYNHNQCSIDFVENYIGLESSWDFFSGYDDFFMYNTLDNPIFIDSDEYKLGFKFAQMVSKRHWVDELYSASEKRSITSGRHKKVE